jgi:2-polyprenyl-3-methyl-5-hydroxy-6-metoxy-1,4-benzoquinol methylase
LSHDEPSSRAPPFHPRAHHTVDDDEVRKFNQMASLMWKEDGEFKALHALNELRVPLVRDALVSPGGHRMTPRPLDGKVILDAGCGGGILAEVCYVML